MLASEGRVMLAPFGRRGFVQHMLSGIECFMPRAYSRR